jgi:RNA polymerase sigma-70 factor (ECF subfamily)
MAMTEDFNVSSGEIPDQDVVDRVRNGDGDSFELIMRRHNRRLYRIARGILRNDVEAEDAVQEAYVRAYENLDRFKGDGPFSAWLAKITVNEALGRLRRAGSAKNSLSLDDPERGDEVNSMAELTFSGPNPEQSVAREEFRRLLESAIDALPETYRLVFILRGLEEMSVAETADCLEVEAATVKTRYHRARKMLQQSLAGLVEATAGEAFPFAGERCDRIVAGVFRRLGIRGQH